MSFAYSILTSSIKVLLHLLCRIEAGQLSRVPDRGPLIIVTNHINFLEPPILYTHLLPRPLAGFAKAETWDNPALRPVVEAWGAIPLHRGEVDRSALSQALTALERGYILGMAPEGTRSGDGRLQPGNSGVVFLALRSGAPLLPVVCYGEEAFWGNVRRLRRTAVGINVGQPFRLDPGPGRVTRRMRQEMTDEIMFQMAALLPPAYRGAYARLELATETYLRFDPGTESNLNRPQTQLPA